MVRFDEGVIGREVGERRRERESRVPDSSSLLGRAGAGVAADRAETVGRGSGAAK